MRRLWLVPGALASGLLLEAALPPVDAHPLVWLVLIPILVASLGQGFAFGFIGGLGAVMIGGQASRMGLFLEPSLLDGDPGWNYLGFFLFGLAIALLCGLVGEVKKIRLRQVFTLSAWAVLFEAALLLYLPAHIALPLH